MLRTVFTAALVVATAALATATPDPQQPQNPVIGIMTDPLDQCGPVPPGVKATSCVESYFSRWLESAGVRVVPFPWNATETYQRWLAKRVNGILFPGGVILGEEMNEYFAKVQLLFKWAAEWNAQGDPFVLWGTCQGFQLLNSAAAGTRSAMTGPYYGMFPKMMSVNFTAAQASSRMFGDATTPASILANMKSKPITLNWHHNIINAELFRTNTGLKNFFKLIAMNNVPGSNTQFVAAVEAYEANVYAVQFHPEKPPYQFTNNIIAHNDDVIDLSQYLVRFLASRLRMNNHSFDSAAQAEGLRLSQWPLADQGWGVRTYYVIDPK